MSETLLNTTTSTTIKIGQVLSKNNDGSELRACRWTKLSQYDIQNWDLNRPPDSARIPEIMKQLKNQDYVDGVIYLTNIDGNIVCYDGIHRIEALKLLSHDIDCMIDHKVFVHYYPVYNERHIKDKFETLNKCIPVPEIYTSAHRELDTKQIVEEVVKYFTEKYASMFKASKKPNLPHENRDSFTDKVYNIITELLLHEFRYNKIIELFIQFNVLMCEKQRFLKLSAKQLKKCNEQDCYMFARKDWDRVFIVSFYNNHLKLSRF